MSSFRFVLRVLGGFLVAALTAALTSYALYFIFWICGVSVIGPADHPLQMAAVLAVGGLLVAIVVIVVGAVPLFVWMHMRGSVSLGNTLWAGAALGPSPYLIFIVSAVLAGPSMSTASDAHGMWSVLKPVRVLGPVVFFATIGVAAAAAFWFAAMSGSGPGSRRRSVLET